MDADCLFPQPPNRKADNDPSVSCLSASFFSIFLIMGGFPKSRACLFLFAVILDGESQLTTQAPE
jgi:hypothetical protein